MRDRSELSDLTVLDEDGAVVALGELYAERPAVLVLVRHFG